MVEGFVCVGGLSVAQRDGGGGGGVNTSPTAVNNPEYFDEDLLVSGDAGQDQRAVLETQQQQPAGMRLRIQSSESTASDHDEYDRLNCCSQSPATMSPRSDTARLKNSAKIDVASVHHMFAESVL